VVPLILLRKSNDDDEVQEEVITWFRGQAVYSVTRGYGRWFQDLINVWTMPATIMKNKVMYRQYIHSPAFVN